MPTIKFRQDTVRTLPYVGRGGKHQCIYWDANLEGFGVRVYPTGGRTYVCTYRVNRRKRLAKLGRVDVLTLDQATKKAKAYLGKVANNDDPLEQSDVIKKAPTVEELVKAYIEGHAKPQKKTWKQDESSLRRNLVADFRLTLAQNITSAEIAAICVRIGAKHPYGANHFLDHVRRMYNWGKTPAKLIPRHFENPVTGVKRFPQRKRRRFLTTVEMPLFIRALEQDESDYARHAVWLLLLTGMRMSEVLKAKWENVDWDMGTLFIGLTKNGEPLLAPLSDLALERLRMIPRISGNPYIICGRDRGTHHRGLQAMLERIKKRSGLTNIRTHDIRRTVGSWLAQSGVSLHLIGDVLNHLDTSTTAGYAYFQTQHRRDALSSHADKVLKLGAPHLLEKAKPQSLVPEKFLAPTNDAKAPSSGAPRTRKRHYFNRDALHRMIWTAPVMEVAERLGVSDVALAKLCRRAAIPTPPRGYWQRIETGQQLPVAPLPPAPEGLPELLRIRGTKSAPSLKAIAA
jgi:integrase